MHPTSSTVSAPKSWDIFCRVIDNYGDIGVCWRLARQLASEHSQQVRLWVDDLNALVRIWPDAQLADQQELAGVDVRHWIDAFPTDIGIAQVVIEAFACDIPDAYLQQMAEQKKNGQAPLWINLEYLSAEPWVEDCHGMVSVHPRTGLRKTFFFPGFTPRTGGLVREQDIAERQHAFDPNAFLNSLGITADQGALLISLFAYENTAVTSLLDAWAESRQPIHCLVPQGKVLASINQYLPKPLASGQGYTRGNLRLDVIPFLTQTQYDELLWACDINFVRGEDSFVRAQWAGKPFVWHIYPQEENAHMAKLDAFLDRFLSQQDQQLTTNVSDLWHNWNQQHDVAGAWSKLMEQLPQWQALSHDWRKHLRSQADLASQLIALNSTGGGQKSTTEKQ
ncbi:elongation factor P maturation arginine rhamnosyltransferase EarP [Cellvibrio sp. pealriver]|uniref:elongation factor P maturation arginine rhamnosyltransferase EarP n=1 Tax=Cellvibrio sp. pealriver TaxID=1622269 RepID=UPI00066FCCDD|nr:elongation factor P maturation arginine rhamnosyltransferase EarP [Cellvibrio sp. pealriver]